MDKDTEKPTTDNNLTVSGESETFDSWTILSDPKIKRKQSSTDVTIASENEPSGIECIASEEEPQKIHENDDLSDGISVISECESADCLSPTITLTSNLNETINENQNNSSNNKYQRYQPMTPPNTPDTFRDQFSQTFKSGPVTTHDRITQYVELISSSSLDIDKQQQETVLSATTTEPLQSSALTRILTVVRQPLSKVFIISSLILLIAFFGNMKFTTNLNDWNLSTNVPQLHQRIENLELQNNLLRAEIDILSKNLNSINQQQLKQKTTNYDHHKDDKKKFKYENTNYQDNEALKIQQQQQQPELNSNERPPSPPPPPPPKNPNLPTYCKDGENLWCSQETKNDENEKQEIDKNSSQNQSNYDNNKKSDDNKNYNRSSSDDNDGKNFKEWQTKDFNKKKFDSRERNDSKENMKKNREKYEKKKFQHYDDDDDDSSERYDSKEDFDKKRKNYENNKKYKNSKKHSNYDDDDDDDDSTERKFDKKWRDSKERYDSREHYDKRKNDGKHQHYEKQKSKSDGDWHERMMQQRENSRKNKNDKMDNNNWYLERGNGREEARVFVKDGQNKSN